MWKRPLRRRLEPSEQTMEVNTPHLSFENYLKAEGIRHKLTGPKTPQQNGVTERLNPTLVEMARSMLLDSKLLKKFWGEAISTAVYLKNRILSKP